MLYAGVAELADAPALGAGAPACRFKSCYPHHKGTVAMIQIATVLFNYSL